MSDVQLATDQMFIEGIFNYSNGRCGRCRFTQRCGQYADENRGSEQLPEGDWHAHVHRSVQRTFETIQAWCQREGVDIAALRKQEPGRHDAARDMARRLRADPLVTLAKGYTLPALRLAEALRRSDDFSAWPHEAKEALDTIEWYAMRVSSKVFRAVSGFELRDESDDEVVQSDWNGSAKVARLEITESRAAWDAILRIGDAPPDSPLRSLIERLDAIDAAVAARFPDAMAFVRPGFDGGAASV
jgi:hypothetical protein